MQTALSALMRGADTPRVAFCSPLWAKGSNITLGWSDYWRLAIPAIALARSGWDVALVRGLAGNPDGSLMILDENGNWRNDREVIVFHRWISKQSAALMTRARGAGQVIINDLDDHFWAFPKDHPGIEVLSPSQGDPEYTLDNYEATLRASSLITVSTPALAKAIADWEPEVQVVRNRIDLSMWSASSKQPGLYHGWVGSTAGREEDLEVLRTVVVPWLKERDLPFYHGGYRPGEPKMKDVLNYDKVVVRQAQSIPRYPRLWDPLKVAFCPLGNTEFARCKSWVKPLEACAREIPFIASNQEEYVELGVGRIASTAQEWIRHLEVLENPEVFAADVQIHRNGARFHSIDRHWQEWARLLTNAVQSKEERNVTTFTWAGESAQAT